MLSSHSGANAWNHSLPGAKCLESMPPGAAMPGLSPSKELSGIQKQSVSWYFHNATPVRNMYNSDRYTQFKLLTYAM